MARKKQIATAKQLQKVKAMLRKKDIKAAMIAEKSGLMKPEISRILNGKKKNIQLTTLKKICDAIGCTSYEFLGW
jgi:DNA-binding Xre family transcriptional regulator